MFYSQFILAKKGPLGTIWIAAHLERKLRKNQVADTDIGVSVDSILFPDAPIALRLSSHLLLGVVRIYSRKVNYLFHDCSDALLKVKQAFRSTAVDLPPEESTAPYHSITLPETFDLDDFELPDSEFFHGLTSEISSMAPNWGNLPVRASNINYVDHHVSTREQITLQDTMDGVVYSTSQFGLDERFGDGDTSQIGLDLDEDLFLDKVTSPRHTASLLDSEKDDLFQGVLPSPSLTFGQATHSSTATPAITLRMDPQASDAPMTPFADMDIDEDQNQLAVEKAAEASEVIVAGDSSFRSNEVETSLFNKKSPENNVPSISNGENGSPSANLQISQDKRQGDSSPTVVSTDPISSNLLGSVSSPTSVLVEQAKPVSPASEGLDRTLTASNSTKRAGTSHVGEASEPLSNGDGVPENDCILQKNNSEQEGKVIPTSVSYDKKLCQPSLMLQACNSLQKESDLVSLEDENLVSAPCLSSRGLEPSSEETLAEEARHASETSAVVEECQTIDVTDTALDAATAMEPIVSVDVQANLTKSEECLDTVISEDNCARSLDCPANSDLPAPEILLSAPAAVPEVPQDLLVDTLDNEALTVQDANADGPNILSGKKRRLMESTPILLDDSSAKLSPSKRTLDSIPDDDDLLSSILVGRRSSILKLRPTPSSLEIASSKRPRVTPRGSLAKRKVVLLDDTMVLHGDTIRQQLTNTEDVRRVRRKAPCTRPEIWVIQKHLLEDEIFSEPLFTGMLADMVSLYNGTYDLSEVKLTENDGEHTPAKSPITKKSSRNIEPNKEDIVQAAGEPVVVGHDGETHVPSGALVQTESLLPEEHPITSENQDQTEAPTADLLREVSSMEVDKLDTGVADAMANASTDGVELLDEKAALVTDVTICKGNDVINVAEEDLTQVEGNSIEKVECHIHESDNGGSVYAVPQIIQKTEDSSENRTDETVDASTPMDKVNHTSESMPVEGNVSAGMVVQTDDHAKEGFTTSDMGVVIEDQFMDEIVRDEGNACPIRNSSEQPQRNSSCSLEINGDAENAPFDEREHPGYQEANLDMSMNAEASAPDTAMRDSVEFGNTLVGNDTGFLNFDDDEVAEEEEDEENGVPDSVEARFLENSGWSSRTRAVGKYLQTLFENESGQPRKTIPVDNLLSGKTRKEASRMFFETLVLKTRDYIHVEQVKPFDNINIKPRVKLMKADF